MGLEVTQGATAEPITTQDAKDHLRVTQNAEDALIEGLVSSTRQWFEDQTRRVAMRQTYRLTLDAFPRTEEITLPRMPVTSSTTVAITYVTTTGTPAKTIDSTDYIVTTGGDHALSRVVLKENADWPTVDLQRADGVRVDFDAGSTTAGDVPQLFRQGMKLLAGHWFEHREGVTVSGSVEEMPLAVKSIIWHYRIP